MKLSIKRIDNSLPLPEYKTSGAVAFDLCSRLDMEIKPFEETLIPLNLVIKVPKGYVLMLASRSSYPKKKLLIPNGFGVIDQDYCGDTDEIKIWALNFSQKNVMVEKGERIAQALLVPIEKAEEFVELEVIQEVSRGGFGSTGKK
jgi:dUTP pyrophosphatase